MIIGAREGKIQTFTESPGQTINLLRTSAMYRHFGNANEDPAPLCQIDDQDAVEVDDGSDSAVLNISIRSAPSRASSLTEKRYMSAAGSGSTLDHFKEISMRNLIILTPPRSRSRSRAATAAIAAT